MNTRDEAVINKLLKISSILGIFPTEKPSWWFLSYQSLMFAFILFSGIFSLYSIFVIFTFKRDTLDVSMDVLCSSFYLMLGVSFQYPTLLHPDEWRNFNKNLKVGCKETKTGDRSALLEVLFINLLFFTRTVAMISMVYSKIGIVYVLYNFSRPLIDSCCIIFLFMIVHVNIIIKKKYLLINKCIMRANSLRYIQRIYVDTTQLVNDFNRIFGYQILFISGRAIIILLQCLQRNLIEANFENIYYSWFYSLTIFVITQN